DPGAQGRSQNAWRNQRYSADMRAWYAPSSCGAAYLPTCVGAEASWTGVWFSWADSFHTARGSLQRSITPRYSRRESLLSREVRNSQTSGMVTMVWKEGVYPNAVSGFVQ